MNVVGGTFVGGSSSGWEIVDPTANAAALGAVPAAVYGGMPVVYGGGAALHGGGQLGSVGYDTGVTATYNPYAGLGTVGGSWSPEPAGNNQIIYGHYSSQGALALPQASNGQQFTTPMTSQHAAATAAATRPTTRTTAPASASGGGSTPADAGTTAAGGDKPAATERKRTTTTRPAAKSVAVKAGDSLSKIAAANGTTWQKLYELNKDVIGSNPNLIRPGQQLKLS